MTIPIPEMEWWKEAGLLFLRDEKLPWNLVVARWLWFLVIAENIKRGLAEEHPGLYPDGDYLTFTSRESSLLIELSARRGEEKARVEVKLRFNW